ncbi:MAG TPA: ATP-dependent DNA helicase RecG, partial [Chloroflexi bacterium]|nr:ATP-dependent DNA helicase RecG [Chloroflexota bacterium]
AAVEERPAPLRVERPAPPRPAPPPPPPPATEPSGLDSPIEVVTGIGKARARQLARLGVRTIRDALYFFPRRYDDFSQLKPINRLEYGEEVTIIATIWQVRHFQTKSGGSIVKAIVGDGTGTMEVTWFNQPYLVDRLRPRRQIVISGKVEEYLGRLTFQSPTWEPLDQELLHTARIVPVYPLTEGVSAKGMRRLMKRVVDYWAPRLPDHLPPDLRERAGLVDLSTALRQMHFPDDWEALHRARRRLAFDELFLIQIGVLRQRHRWQARPGWAVPVDEALLERFLAGLPFRLTNAQRRALEEILADLRQERPMNRLLQGDVGSGKTVVAAAAMALTAAAGAQAALMAPTEILAEQHFRNLSRLFETMDDPRLRPTLRLLTGSTPAAEKKAIYEGLADGSIQIVVGTHALIQAGVTFQKLALAVIDEQHRFGVRQRAALRQKGHNPHVLVMTATPIPRSLALTIYGDLDLSIIDEMPPGRRPIETHVLLPTERERAYSFIRAQVRQGHQAYIICPLVEGSEKLEAKAAVEEYERLSREVFYDLRVGLLHGRMKGEEKEAVMRRFADGELDILVATSVVEVGIDVPNATVMLIEGANRFGLAQLHQFRGRVGRGDHPSYCLLLADRSTPESRERLKAVEATQDGFLLAEKDLEMRGPGEFFGTRQSGLPDLKVAGMGDSRLLDLARREAQRLMEADPELQRPEHRLLARRVATFWQEESEIS